jgi:hypothetical protein
MRRGFPNVTVCHSSRLSFGDDFARSISRFAFTALAPLSLGNAAEREVTPDRLTALVTHAAQVTFAHGVSARAPK